MTTAPVWASAWIAAAGTATSARTATSTWASAAPAWASTPAGTAASTWTSTSAKVAHGGGHGTKRAFTHAQGVGPDTAGAPIDGSGRRIEGALTHGNVKRPSTEGAFAREPGVASLVLIGARLAGRPVPALAAIVLAGTGERHASGRDQRQSHYPYQNACHARLPSVRSRRR